MGGSGRGRWGLIDFSFCTSAGCVQITNHGPSFLSWAFKSLVGLVFSACESSPFQRREILLCVYRRRGRNECKGPAKAVLLCCHLPGKTRALFVVSNPQLGAGDFSGLQLISRRHGSVALQKMAALKGVRQTAPSLHSGPSWRALDQGKEDTHALTLGDLAWESWARKGSSSPAMHTLQNCKGYHI